MASVPADPALHLGDLLAGSEQVLNVVADLMSNHVGLGEFARRMEPSLQLVIEGQIDVDLLIGGAIKRPDGGARQSATLGIDLIREHDQKRLLVGPAGPGEKISPDVLGHGQRRPDEVRLSLFLGAPGRRFLPGGARLGDLHPLHQDPGVGSREKAHHQHDQDRADTTTYRNLASRDPPSVLDVIAPAFVLPSHVWLSEVDLFSLTERVSPDSRTQSFTMKRGDVTATLGFARRFRSTNVRPLCAAPIVKTGNNHGKHGRTQKWKHIRISFPFY